MKYEDIELESSKRYDVKLSEEYNAGYNQGFLEGAEWRLNSIWHTMEEEPQVYGEYKDNVMPQIPCLVLGHLSTGYGYGVRYWNSSYKVWDDEECDDYECSKDNIEKWCYLDDLLPIE